MTPEKAFDQARKMPALQTALLLMTAVRVQTELRDLVASASYRDPALAERLEMLAGRLHVALVIRPEVEALTRIATDAGLVADVDAELRKLNARKGGAA